MAGDEDISPPPTKLAYNSLLFFGPQDRPGNFITPIRLKLDNIDEWSHSIRVALTSHRKFDFLNGTINTYSPPCTKDDCVTIHCMLVSWLMNTVDSEVKCMLFHYDDAKKL